MENLKAERAQLLCCTFAGFEKRATTSLHCARVRDTHIALGLVVSCI